MLPMRALGIHMMISIGKRAFVSPLQGDVSYYITTQGVALG
jgi:hypothetical protein